MSIFHQSPATLCPICRTPALPGKLACLNCGTRLDVFEAPAAQPSGTLISEHQKSKIVAILLASLGIIGFAGLHRFYTEKHGTGMLMLFTLGGFFIWTWYDLRLLVDGDFVDDRGLPLR